MTSTPTNTSIGTEHLSTRTDLTTSQKRVLGRVRRELVRRECVEEYSSSPLWQARAAGNPDYWKRFYVGQANLYNKDRLSMLSSVEALLKQHPEMAEVLLMAFGIDPDKLTET